MGLGTMQKICLDHIREGLTFRHGRHAQIFRGSVSLVLLRPLIWVVVALRLPQGLGFMPFPDFCPLISHCVGFSHRFIFLIQFYTHVHGLVYFCRLHPTLSFRLYPVLIGGRHGARALESRMAYKFKTNEKNPKQLYLMYSGLSSNLCKKSMIRT